MCRSLRHWSYPLNKKILDGSFTKLVKIEYIRSKPIFYNHRLFCLHAHTYAIHSSLPLAAPTSGVKYESSTPWQLCFVALNLMIDLIFEIEEVNAPTDPIWTLQTILAWCLFLMHWIVISAENQTHTQIHDNPLQTSFLYLFYKGVVSNH